MLNIPETIVLSLLSDEIRRKHIREHFAAIGISDCRFHDAISADSPLVASWYATGRVKGYPPCFRCGKPQCNCSNNILIPAQVANCLSFAELWAGLPKDPERHYLICEDDVLFYPGALERLASFLAGLTPSAQPFLLRLSESGLPPDRKVECDLRTTRDHIMSNPAYIINGAMATLLTTKFAKIETTSDIWLHVNMATDQGVEALSIEPRLATELSFNASYARFVSHIHPKGINEADRERQLRHIKRVENSSQYDRVRRQWEGTPVQRQWNYLASPPFQMRYLLTAGLLRKFSNILELGAYKTPIFKFLEDGTKSVRCIDPMIVPEEYTQTQRSEGIDYRSLELAPFGNQPFALAILGLDIPITYKIIHYLQTAEIAVIEFPEDATWKRSREIFDKLVIDAKLNILSRVGMNFDDNDFSMCSGPIEWPPRTQRYIFIVSSKYQSLDELDKHNPFVKPVPVIDTSGSRLINTTFARDHLFTESAFEFSHGGSAATNYLGGGLLYYTLAYMLKARVCVCLGSGGAFVPRLMRQAQRDIGMGEVARTILVDGDRGSYGRPNWLAEDSVFRLTYPDIEIRITDTASAATEMLREGILIDYLHVDADHSHEGCLQDFDTYLPLMRKDGLITFHDTRPNVHANTTCWQAVKDIKSRGYELIDLPFIANGVAIIKFTSKQYHTKDAAS